MIAMRQGRHYWSRWARTFVVISAIGGFVLAAQTAVADSCDLSAAAKARDEADIKETMAAYNAALNGGETTAVLLLYTDDGCSCRPTAIQRRARKRSKRRTTKSSTN